MLAEADIPEGLGEWESLLVATLVPPELFCIQIGCDVGYFALSSIVEGM